MGETMPANGCKKERNADRRGNYAEGDYAVWQGLLLFSSMASGSTQFAARLCYSRSVDIKNQ